MRGENRSTWGKTSHGRVENQQTQPHITPSAKIEPGPHWWKASALATRPTLPHLSENSESPRQFFQEDDIILALDVSDSNDID